MRRVQLLRTGVLLVAVALFVAGCGTDAGSSGAPPDSVAPSTSIAGSTTTTIPVDITAAPDKPTPTTTPPPSDDGAQPPGVDPPGNAQVQLAIADLAAMLGVDASTIDLVTQEEVVWRDGSIGCPQPGMSYTQALVDGTRIVLEHDGVRYEYHAGGGRDPFYCADPAE